MVTLAVAVAAWHAFNPSKAGGSRQGAEETAQVVTPQKFSEMLRNLEQELRKAFHTVENAIRDAGERRSGRD